MFALFRPQYWFALIVLYFGTHFAFEIRFSPGVERIADASVLSDTIYLVLNQIPVPPHVAETALGHVFIALTFVCLFRIVATFGRIEWAWISVLCLFFVPQIVWVRQHGGGVNNLDILLPMVTIWAFARLLDQRNLVAYGLFGASMALCVLAAPLMALIPATLLAAMLTHKAGLGLIWNGRAWLMIVVLLMWSAPAWTQLATAVPETITAITTNFWPRITTQTQGMHLLVQATLSFAGFVIVGLAFLFHHGLGVMPKVDPAFLHLRQILSRQVALVFGLYLLAFPALGAGAITMERLLPFLMLLIPLCALYVTPLFSTHTREMIARGAIAVAILILIASPTQYGSTEGGVTAWYLELRASEGARAPLL